MCALPINHFTMSEPYHVVEHKLLKILRLALSNYRPIDSAQCSTECEGCHMCASDCPCVSVGNLHVRKCETSDCKNAVYTCTDLDGICDDCAEEEEEYKCYTCDTLIDSTSTVCGECYDVIYYLRKLPCERYS